MVLLSIFPLLITIFPSVASLDPESSNPLGSLIQQLLPDSHRCVLAFDMGGTLKMESVPILNIEKRRGEHDVDATLSFECEVVVTRVGSAEVRTQLSFYNSNKSFK